MSTTRFTPDPSTKLAFRAALGQFATGVTIVTCAGSAGPLGMTVNSFTSVSLDPPLVLWAPGRYSRRFDAFAGAEHYAIHVLAADQGAVASAFAREAEAFDLCDWERSAEGVPLIAGCLASFECTKVAEHDGGDHAIIVGRVTAAAMREGAPLLFHAGTYGRFIEGTHES